MVLVSVMRSHILEHELVYCICFTWINNDNLKFSILKGKEN